MTKADPPCTPFAQTLPKASIARPFATHSAGVQSVPMETTTAWPAALPESTPHVQTYRHPRRLLAGGFAAGLIANAWFVDAPLGIGFFLFALGWVIALRALGGRESWQRAGAVRWLLLPMLACAGFVAVRDAPTLVALNVLAVGALACLSVQLFSGERAIASLGLRGYFAATVAGAARGVFAGPVLVSDSVDVEGIGSGLRSYGIPVFRAAAFAVPVLLVFGGLLISADEVFKTLLASRWDSLTDGDWVGVVSTVGVVSGVALVCSGLWAIALRRRDRTATAPVRSAERRVHRGAFEAFAVVGSLIVLFGGFGAIQAACLFGQVALPAELTWAEYAREGFFQLLIVAGLTIALLTILSRVVRLPAKLTGPFAAACTALVGLTLVILASAVKRITLYEEAYGFTELRVYSHVFAFALGAMLLWRAVTLWRWTQSFATGAVVALLGFVLSLDVLNPDAFIATRNLERHAQSGDIDRNYLSQLSADAAPVLAPWAAKSGQPELFEQQLSRNPRLSAGGFPSANLSRLRALELAPQPSALTPL
jgi:hypothetical protein